MTSGELACARAEATAQLNTYASDSETLITQQTSRLVVLNRRKQKLIDAYLDETLSAEDVTARQVEVNREIATATHQLRTAEEGRAVLYERLETVLAALEHAATFYDTASDDIKRRLNQAIFEPFQIDLLDQHGQPVPEAMTEAHCTATGALTAPAAAVAALAGRKGGTGAHSAENTPNPKPGEQEKTPGKLALTGGSNVTHLAETEGFEPSVPLRGLHLSRVVH